jgi:Subtilase family
VTVAATNSDETLAAFSNYGPGVEVAAPGGINVSPKTNGLKSTGIDWECPEWESCPVYCFYTISYCGTYGEDSGTSMAAPVVAGIAALVREKNPNLTADEAGVCITSTAGTAGVGYATKKSDVPFGNVYKQDPSLPQNGPVPIANAAAAVECAPRGTASSYSGSGGGDGWAIALSQTSVYNVFHHSDILQIACHFQADASPCWESPETETITDDSGDDFATSGQPGLWLDQNTGHLFVFATRTPDQTAGVVCIDTTKAAENPDPFCGFTALTGAGEAAFPGISSVSNPTLVGSRWYAFNYVQGATVNGDENKLLCFDTNKDAPCAGQPFSITHDEGVVEDGSYPPPAVTSIAAEVIIPARLGSAEHLFCFDGNSESPCGAEWPVPITGYDSGSGAAFPFLNTGGTPIGLCLPTGIDPCYSLAGSPIATPAGLTNAIPGTSGWNGPALVRGARVYVPNGNDDTVDCYDYGAGAGCANFPRGFANLGLLYTVNSDPERPRCLWVNSDNGAGQIQNFDAFTAEGCE